MATSKYKDWLTEDGLLRLAAWARDGLTDEQIASNIGISRSTLGEWRKKYPDISDTLKREKEIIDVQVENALLKRALGYTFTETTRERVNDYDPDTGEKIGTHLEITKTVEKEVQPDTTAQIFWLKNRKPETWRDKKDIGVEGSLKTESSLTDEELEDRISKLKLKLGLSSD